MVLRVVEVELVLKVMVVVRVRENRCLGFMREKGWSGVSVLCGLMLLG